MIILNENQVQTTTLFNRISEVYFYSSIQKKRISIETRFFTKCISMNLYLIFDENQGAD